MTPFLVLRFAFAIGVTTGLRFQDSARDHGLGRAPKLDHSPQHGARFYGSTRNLGVVFSSGSSRASRFSSYCSAKLRLDLSDQTAIPKLRLRRNS